jgi:hypothetical protein
MSGLLRRLTRRRPATAEETGFPTPASSEPAGASADGPTGAGGGDLMPQEPGGGRALPAPVGNEQATEVLPATGDAAEHGEVVGPEPRPSIVAAEQATPSPQPAPVRDLPAGIDPSELATAPVASAPRGKLRRRLRYLRQVRELLLRDLGGFAYEIQRTAGGTPQESHRRLLEGKTNRIAALDAEVRGLEDRLAEPHAEPVLREPGIGGTCPECGELHASDAHYCAHCGAPLNAKARARRDAAVAAAVHQTTASHPTAEPAQASVLWAAGPRPVRSAAEQEPEEEASHPSAATSQWLALPHREPSEVGEPRAIGDESEETAGEAASAPAGDESGEGSAAAEPGADEETSDAGETEPPVNEPSGDADEARAEFEPGPNGRREDDVPSPLSPADHLTARRQQGP